jgi:DNA ligase-1
MQLQTSHKYTSRPSPPYAARDGRVGTRKRGNDGCMYVIAEDKRGVLSWRKGSAGKKAATSAAGRASPSGRRQERGAAPKPMLASTSNREPVFPVYAQPKLDGYRMLFDTRSQKAWSRTGKELAVPHIVHELRSMKLETGCVLDGELYLHGQRFQDIQHMVNSEHPDLEFWVFDMFRTKSGGGAEQFTQRYAELAAVLEHSKGQRVKLVPTRLLSSPAAVEALHNKMAAKGFEGLVLRTPESPYVHGRSAHLIKVKRFMDAEFKVTGYKARKDGVGIVWSCETQAGDTFWVNDPKGPAPGSIRSKRMVNTYLTVQFQDEFDTGIPRFPVAKGFRDAADLER